MHENRSRLLFAIKRRSSWTNIFVSQNLKVSLDNFQVNLHKFDDYLISGFKMHPRFRIISNISKLFLERVHFLFLFSVSCVTGRSAPIYKVLSIDYSSALEMLNKEYQEMSFDDLDLLEDLKVCLAMVNTSNPKIKWEDSLLYLWSLYLKNETRRSVNILNIFSLQTLAVTGDSQWVIFIVFNGHFVQVYHTSIVMLVK